MGGAPGGKRVGNTIAIDTSIVLDRLSWTTQGERWANNRDSLRMTVPGCENTEIFRILSNPSSAPLSWAKLVGGPGHGFYHSAISILPNDEDSLFH